MKMKTMRTMKATSEARELHTMMREWAAGVEERLVDDVLGG
jgi:hypothetical protein